MEQVFSVIIFLLGLFMVIYPLPDSPWVRNDVRTKFWIGLLGERGVIIMNRIIGIVIIVIGILSLLGIINFFKNY